MCNKLTFVAHFFIAWCNFRSTLGKAWASSNTIGQFNLESSYINSLQYDVLPNSEVRIRQQFFSFLTFFNNVIFGFKSLPMSYNFILQPENLIASAREGQENEGIYTVWMFW